MTTSEFIKVANRARLAQKGIGAAGKFLGRSGGRVGAVQPRRFSLNQRPASRRDFSRLQQSPPPGSTIPASSAPNSSAQAAIFRNQPPPQLRKTSPREMPGFLQPNTPGQYQARLPGGQVVPRKTQGTVIDRSQLPAAQPPPVNLRPEDARLIRRSGQPPVVQPAPAATPATNQAPPVASPAAAPVAAPVAAPGGDLPANVGGWMDSAGGFLNKNKLALGLGAGGFLAGRNTGYEKGNQAGYGAGVGHGYGTGFSAAQSQAQNTPWMSRMTGQYQFDPAAGLAGLGDADSLQQHRLGNRHGLIARHAGIPFF